MAPLPVEIEAPGQGLAHAKPPPPPLPTTIADDPKILPREYHPKTYDELENMFEGTFASGEGMVPDPYVDTNIGRPKIRSRSSNLSISEEEIEADINAAVEDLEGVLDVTPDYPYDGPSDLGIVSVTPILPGDMPNNATDPVDYLATLDDQTEAAIAGEQRVWNTFFDWFSKPGNILLIAVIAMIPIFIMSGFSILKRMGRKLGWKWVKELDDRENMDLDGGDDSGSTSGPAPIPLLAFTPGSSTATPIYLQRPDGNTYWNGVMIPSHYPHDGQTSLPGGQSDDLHVSYDAPPSEPPSARMAPPRTFTSHTSPTVLPPAYAEEREDKE